MEKRDFILSTKLTFIFLFGATLFWFLFSCQLLWAYDPGGAPLDLKKYSRMNDTILIQPGTGTSGGSGTARFRTYYGTQACVGVGSSGYIPSGTLTGLPFIDYLYGNGSSTIDFNGFNHVAVGGSDIPSSSSVSGKIDAVSGTGTTNTFTDTTLDGQGTITATFRVNGVDVSPAELGYIDGASSNLQTQITGKQDSIGQTPLGSSVGSVTSALGSQSVDALLDMVISSPVNGHVLMYNGSNWGNSTSSASVAFSSVTGSVTSEQLPITHQGTTTPTAGYTVIGDVNGKITKWIPVNISSSIKTNVQSITSAATWETITGLSANLSLGSTTSKILVNCTLAGVADNSAYGRILRNGTPIAIGDASGSTVSCTFGSFWTGESTISGISQSVTIVDTSPGTTTVSYTVQGYSRYGGSAGFVINRIGDTADDIGRGRTVSSLVVQELY